MKVRLLQAVVGFFLVIVLSGCNDKLLPNFWLYSNAPTNLYARQVATAVDAKGWNHTLWNECFTSGPENCRLVYARYSVSEPAPTGYKYLQPTDFKHSYIDPDIAVTDDGVAYGVWKLKDTSTNPASYSNCWQNLSTGSSACTVFFTGNNLTNNAAPTGVPRIAARGSTIYAVIEEKNGLGTQLLYRRLSPLSNIVYEISPKAVNSVNTSVDLTISPEGTLHVVWNDGAIWYADNLHTTGLMAHMLKLTYNGQLSEPKITIDEGGLDKAILYISYVNYEQAYYGMSIRYCLYSNCPQPVAETKVDLSIDPPWNLLGSPSIAATGSTDGPNNSMVYGAFTATNKTTTSSQVFRFSLPYGAVSPAPFMVTQPADSPTGKSSPIITMVHDNTPGSTLVTPLIAWRNEWMLPTAASDMYIYNLPSEIRKVFTTKPDPAYYTPGSFTFDLSSYGTHAGGVWIDTLSSTDPRRLPWVSMYVTQVFLPLIKGPAQTYLNDGP